MRLCVTLLFCIIAAMLLACASSRSLNPSAKPDDVVLEIVDNASGMVYPKQGDILDFRLHESGRFEYDDYPEQDPPRVTAGNVVITRKEARLNDVDVRELVNLAEQPDFLNANPEYPATRPTLDARFVKTIVYTHQGRVKKIVITDYDDDVYAGTMSQYPKSMVMLLERVKALKAKSTSRS